MGAQAADRWAGTALLYRLLYPLLYSVEVDAPARAGPAQTDEDGAGGPLEPGPHARSGPAAVAVGDGRACGRGDPRRGTLPRQLCVADPHALDRRPDHPWTRRSPPTPP